MLAWSFWRNPRPLPTLRQVRDSSIIGALLLGGGNSLVAIAEQTMPSGIAALFIALLPAWLVVFGRIFVRERISRPVAAGIVIGLAGVAILVGPWEAGGSLDAVGILAVLGSPILWSTGSIFSTHRADEPADPVRAIGIQMLAGGVVTTVLAFVLGDWARFDPYAVSTTSLIALVYLITIGSIVGYSSYIWLIRHAPLAKVATYAYVNPVVAFVLGAWLASEPITPRTAVAAAVIVFAVALIVTARSRHAPPRTNAAPDVDTGHRQPGAAPAASSSSG
jgi:drug/metabolite transporter (DMT)-like permease